MARMYRNYEIYHLSYDLVIQTYKVLEKFPESENRNIISQIKRAVVSVPLNIAEGSAKRSEREFLSYLNISYGSCKELEVLFSLSKDLSYLDKKEFDFLSEKLDKLNAKLFGFIGSVEKKASNKQKFFQKFNKK